MRFRRVDELPKVNATGCIILPVSLFVALMIATAGFAVWPGVAAPGAAIVCGGGEVVHDASEYRRPGEYALVRHISCQTGSGKTGTREDITMSAMGVSFLIYAVVLFLLLQFVVRPLVARRLRAKMETLGFGGRDRPGAATGLGGIIGRVQDAVQRGEAEIRARDVPGADEDGGDIAGRLARLKALRDRGLITAQDYEAKKAEILAGL
jgi:hypothetical protein